VAMALAAFGLPDLRATDLRSTERGKGE